MNDWLFAIQRFAVTLHENDRNFVLTLARMMDTSGVIGRSGFRFFERTSTQVCAAISERAAPESDTVLRGFVGRIDNHRLARSLASATGLDCGSTRGTPPPRRPRTDLWRGLDEPRRRA